MCTVGNIAYEVPIRARYACDGSLYRLAKEDLCVVGIVDNHKPPTTILSLQPLLYQQKYVHLRIIVAWHLAFLRNGSIYFAKSFGTASIDPEDRYFWVYLSKLIYIGQRNLGFTVTN